MVTNFLRIIFEDQFSRQNIRYQSRQFLDIDQRTNISKKDETCYTIEK